MSHAKSAIYTKEYRKRIRFFGDKKVARMIFLGGKKVAKMIFGGQREIAKMMSEQKIKVQATREIFRPNFVKMCKV